MSGAQAVGLAGLIAVIGGYRRESGWPKNGTKGIIATVSLVLLMNVLDGTAIAPISQGLSYLLLMAAVFVTVGTWNGGK